MLWDTVGQGQAKRSRPPHHRGPAQLPASPAQREEHRQEQEALRAQLEGERLRSQELLRCHTAKRRELQEVAQRERQLLADRLRCAWEQDIARLSTCWGLPSQLPTMYWLNSLLSSSS